MTQSSNARDSMFVSPSEKLHLDKRTSTADSTSTSNTFDKSRDVNKIMSTVARMNEPKLQNQRFDLGPEKENELAELDIIAKLERALSRRMDDQAANFTTKRTRSAASTTGASSSMSMSKEVSV